MSLVIIKIIDGEIYIQSETKLTDNKTLKKVSHDGALKCLIANKQIAICWAGNIEYARDFLYKYKWIRCPSTTQLIQELCGYTKIYSNHTDFLIASLEYGEPRIFKISNGECKDGDNSYWIGDQDAFEEFQYSWLKLSEQKAVDFQNCFRDTVRNSSLESIGKQIIQAKSMLFPLASNPEVKVAIFNYLESGEAVSGMPISINIPANETVAINLGNEEQGSFTVSQFVNKDPNDSLVCLYYPFGKFGLVFDPSQRLEPVKYTNLNVQDFVKACEKDFVPISGVYSDGLKIRVI